MLYLPRVGGTKHGLKSFRCFAAKTWNALSETTRAMAGATGHGAWRGLCGKLIFKKDSSRMILNLNLTAT